MKKVLDLSEHNGSINFAKVKEDGFQDVILRLGWIGNKENHTQDLKFEEYYAQCRYYGFNIGVYIYSYCKNQDTLLSGCRWALNKLTSKEINLPIFLDLEDDSISNLGKENLTNQAIEFCKYFQNFGFTSGVYANKYWFTTKLEMNKLLNYKLWWAEYNGKDNPTNNYKIDLWQYTSKGKVSGINTNVDISKCMCECDKINTHDITGENVQNGDDVDMKMYFNGSRPEPIYSDTNLSNKIGSLNPYEQCECLGIFKNRAMVRYKVDGKENFKIGFAKWLGGVK